MIYRFGPLIFLLFGLISCHFNRSETTVNPAYDSLPEFKPVLPKSLLCNPDTLCNISWEKLPHKDIKIISEERINLPDNSYHKTYLGLNTKEIEVITAHKIEAFTFPKSSRGLPIQPVLRNLNGAGNLTGKNSSWFYLGAEQGMPGSTVNSLFTDKQNRLWFGTDGGLALYEGLNLQLFSSANGLPHNYVTAIASAHGNFYIGTKGGLAIIADSIYHFSPKEIKEIGSDEITAIYSDEEALLIGTTSGLIGIFGTEGFSFNKASALPGNDIKQISALSSNHWLISTMDGGSFYLKRNSGNKFSVQKIALPGLSVSCHSEDDKASFYFGILHEGIVRLTNDSLFQLNDESNITKKILITDIECEGKNIHCSSFGGGFYTLKPNGEIKAWNKELNEQAAQLSNVIHCDADGGLLVGGAGGLLKQHANFSFLGEAAGLVSAVPTAVAYDKSGNLYTATIKGGVQVINSSTRRLINKENGLSNNNCPFIFASTSGKVLISTSGSGLDILRDGKIYHLQTLGKIELRNVNCAIEDSQGRIWIGSNEEGLLMWSDDKVYHFNRKHFLSNQSVYSITELSDGSIAIGTNGDGLLIWNNGKMLQYGKEQGIRNPVVYPVLEEEGVIYFGTYGSGLYMIKEKEMAHLNDSCGLPDNSILSITKISRNKFILGTARGLATMQMLPYHISVKGKKDGLFYEDFQALAASYDAQSDAISMGSGDVLFQWKSVNQALKEKSLPLLSAVMSNGKLIAGSLLGGKSLTEKSNPAEIEFRDNRMQFYFGYSGSVMESQRKEIAFRLIGYQDNWQYSSQLRQYEYNNLAEGNYRFEYTLKDAAGYWTEPVVFSFGILPPWYRSIYAYGAYGLCFVFTLVGFSKFRNRQLIKKNLELEEIVAERTMEVVKQKDEIMEGKKIVEAQNLQLEEKNHEIIESINYARHLQNAILPSRLLMDQKLPDYFLMYRPKDIVAGDFYWFEPYHENGNEKLFFAVADCTGHGVPGAMVSVVCSNALNRALLEFGITEPGLILEKVRELVIETFRKSESEVKDGMDISLVCYDRANKEIKWAGANNPLWIIRAGGEEVIEIKADKQPVGLHFDPKPFTTHTLSLSGGDCFYLISDGYADQFGGEKGKKFKSAVFKQLLISLSGLSMWEQEEKVAAAFDQWKEGYEQVDDVSVWGVRHKDLKIEA